MPLIPAPSVRSSVPSMSQRTSERFIHEPKAQSIPRFAAVGELEVPEHAGREPEIGDFGGNFDAHLGPADRFFYFRGARERDVGDQSQREAEMGHRRDDQLRIERECESAESAAQGSAGLFLAGTEIRHSTPRPEGDGWAEAQGISDAWIDQKGISRGTVRGGSHTVGGGFPLGRSMQVTNRSPDRQTWNDRVIEGETRNGMGIYLLAGDDRTSAPQQIDGGATFGGPVGRGIRRRSVRLHFERPKIDPEKAVGAHDELTLPPECVGALRLGD